MNGTRVVERGDTLSKIANEELGGPERYPEIYAASKDTAQPGDRQLVDPDLILPGWTLTIPGAATPATAPTAPTRGPAGHGSLTDQRRTPQRAVGRNASEHRRPPAGSVDPKHPLRPIRTCARIRD